MGTGLNILIDRVVLICGAVTDENSIAAFDFASDVFNGGAGV